MSMIYYRKPTLGISGTPLTHTETGSTLAYYRPLTLSSYGL